MRQTAIFIALAVASMAGSFVKSVIDSLSWPALTGIALTLFSGFFIFTVMTSQSPIRWKPIQISPAIAEHLRNAVTLAGVLMIFFATAVILVAIAATGPDQPFLKSLMIVVKCLPRMIDV